MRRSGGRFTRRMECTAYCSCGYCCNWEWGIRFPGFHLAIQPKWPPLWPKRSKPSGYEPHRKFRLFERFWTATSLRGEPYLGLTATEVMPKQARRGILHPTTWAEPGRLIGRALRPWRLIGSQGTAAADPSHLPFGTQLYVPGHGWCKVEDTGGDILGPTRLDLYHDSHSDALHWGRRHVPVTVILPGSSRIDALPQPVRAVAKALDAVKHALY